MKTPARSARAAFTLIELLCVIAIIATLAGLLFPAVSSALARANNVKCVNNLRQMGMAAQMAANDNDNRFPIIEINPDNPVIPPDWNAKPLTEALAPYGMSKDNFICPADAKGPTKNHLTYGTSYMWQPYSEDELTTGIIIYGRRGQFTPPLSRVRLATDWEPVHESTLGAGKNVYAVYADGHVSTTTRSRK